VSKSSLTSPDADTPTRRRASPAGSVFENNSATKRRQFTSFHQNEQKD